MESSMKEKTSESMIEWLKWCQEQIDAGKTSSSTPAATPDATLTASAISKGKKRPLVNRSNISDVDDDFKKSMIRKNEAFANGKV